MSPSAARALVIALSFAVLAISALATSFVWSLLTPLQPLPRAVVSLLVWVSAYYIGANLLFWKAVVRLSSITFSQRN